MIKLISVFVFLAFCFVEGFGQTGSLTGKLTDAASKEGVQGASVVIYLNDSTKKQVDNTVTDGTGNFELKGLANNSYLVAISSVGYQRMLRPVVVADTVKDMGVLLFTKQGKDLEDVTVISRAPAVSQKGDTTQYSASEYKTNRDATTEDLIKKMPGISVATNGTVTAHGETVQKVTVDGKDFFGDDATAALRNLPSEVVDKIQVYDRLSDQAQLTGFDDGNSVKAINIVTKSGIKNGQFGRIYAGYGTDDRYAAGGNVSFFKDNRRISFIGNFNSINQQNFGSQDLLGVTSSGGGRGGGGGGGNTNNFSVGQSPGISKTNAFGINYSNVFAKKLTVTGSYFFNNTHNTNESITNTETFASPKNLYSTQQANALNNNTNHRINMRIEYKIDSANTIYFIPSFNYQTYNSSGTTATQNFYDAGDSLSTSVYQNPGSRSGYNIRNNIMFLHAFHKKGRTISLGLNTNYSKNDGNSITNAQYRFFRDAVIVDSLQQQSNDNNTNGHTIGGKITYTEPIGKKNLLQIDYTPSVQKNKADQETYSFDGQKYSLFDTLLSNKFDNTVTTNNVGLNFRRSKNKDEQLSFGVNFQDAKLESQRVFPIQSAVDQSFFDVLPNAMFRKKFSSNSNLRLFYRASINFPSVSQLQDVVNLSNPLNVSSGNPALKESYTNLLSGRYIFTNSKTSRSFIANVFFQTAANYISNATFIAQKDSVIQQGIVLNKGSQLTKPVNLDGYQSVRTFLTYSLPVKPLKTVININAGFNYTRLPGEVNAAAILTNNYVYNTGVVFASNISEYVDFTVSYNAAFNNAATTSLNKANNNYVNQTAGLLLNLMDKKGWFVKNDITSQAYSGLTAGLNKQFYLWNAAIGKKFLKKQAGELKLSVFDLLKQNQSIVRTVTSANVQDVQSQVLQQYFMLTFTYSLRNFGIAAKSFNGNFRSRDGMGGPGMGGRNPSF